LLRSCALDGFTFVVSERDGKRGLVLRDAQHEYEFVEEPGKAGGN
jgi:hypothetical protein